MFLFSFLALILILSGHIPKEIKSGIGNRTFPKSLLAASAGRGYGQTV
jgi:hypothetical protein